jgi:glyoxylase-like metal-dependent hydrolase (beta-lactamase superfamily II)
MAWPTATIVNIGYLSMNKHWGETARTRWATATCTLVTVGDTRLIVDPSPYPEALEHLLFVRTGLKPSAVGAVLLTHHHADHRYGLPLFDHAQWFMAEAGIAEWRQSSPGDAAVIARFAPAAGRLPEGLRLEATPGHTMSHHSLVMGSPWGPLYVAGDAVMTPEFFVAEEGLYNSTDLAVAAETVRRIKHEAALVIPGHGNMILNLPPRT